MSIARDKKTIGALAAAICTALIATSSLKMGLTIALASSIVLLLTSLFMNILKGRAPANMLALFYIAFAAFFTSLADLIFQAYIPEVYGELGIYVPLIIFSTSTIIQVLYDDGSYSIKRVVKTSISLILGLSVIGLVRGLIGKGLPSTLEHPTAFIIIGLLFALASGIANRKKLV